MPIELLWLFLFLGPGLVIVAMFDFATSPLFKKNALTLMATVVTIQSNPKNCTSSLNKSENTPTYAPIYEYIIGGEIVRSIPSCYTNIITVQVGQVVKLKVLLAKPQKPVRISRFNYSLPWAFLTAGILMIFIVFKNISLLIY
jgi:hypothetical protein